MPCHAAISQKRVTASPNDTVEQVMKLAAKNKVSNIPILDEAGKLLGVFSLKVLLKNLIPVSVVMDSGLQMDIKVSAAPGVAKRLAKVKPLPVSEVMERKFNTVEPDAPLWEGVSQLTKHGSPVVVMDSFGKFSGIMTYNSLVAALEEMNDSD